MKVVGVCEFQGRRLLGIGGVPPVLLDGCFILASYERRCCMKRHVGGSIDCFST